MTVRTTARNTGPWIIGALAAVFCSSVLVGDAKKNETDVVIAPGAFVQDRPTRIAEGRVVTSDKCAVDDIDGEGGPHGRRIWHVRRGNGVALNGWAFQLGGVAPGEEVYVRLDGAGAAYFAVTRSRYGRPDVNDYYGVNPGDAGFRLAATTEQIEPGTYTLTLLVPSNGTMETCDARATLVIE